MSERFVFFIIEIYTIDNDSEKQNILQNIHEWLKRKYRISSYAKWKDRMKGFSLMPNRTRRPKQHHQRIWIAFSIAQCLNPVTANHQKCFRSIHTKTISDRARKAHKKQLNIQKRMWKKQNIFVWSLSLTLCLCRCDGKNMRFIIYNPWAWRIVCTVKSDFVAWKIVERKM